MGKISCSSSRTQDPWSLLLEHLYGKLLLFSTHPEKCTNRSVSKCSSWGLCFVLNTILTPQQFCGQSWQDNCCVVSRTGTFWFRRAREDGRVPGEAANSRAMTIGLRTCSDTCQLCGPGQSPWCLSLEAQKCHPSPPGWTKGKLQQLLHL